MEGKKLVMVKLRNGAELHIFREDPQGIFFIDGLELKEDGVVFVENKCLNFDTLSEDEQMANGLYVHEEYPADVIMQTVFVEGEVFEQYLLWRNHFIKTELEAAKKAQEQAQANHPMAQLLGGGQFGPRMVIDDEPEDEAPAEEPELKN
ncbi:MAG: hypothetical protein ACTSVR_03145 [Candidatus Thorarchaeota archaeon]